MPTLNTEDEPVRGEVVLYRAVDRHEATDIEAHGFQPVPNSMPGKWFATTHELARRWGTELGRMRRAAGAEPFMVVAVRLPAAFVAELHHLPMLDGIGPAYFAAEEQLRELNAVGTVAVAPEMYYP